MSTSFRFLGLRSLVKLLWQPLDTASRLELVIFFTRLLFIGLSFDGRPIQCHEDLFNLFFTRYVRSRLLKNVAEKPKLCRPFTLTNKKFPVGPTSQVLASYTLLDPIFVWPIVRF